jgi:hypothetical protein
MQLIYMYHNLKEKEFFISSKLHGKSSFWKFSNFEIARFGQPNRDCIKFLMLTNAFSECKIICVQISVKLSMRGPWAIS